MGDTVTGQLPAIRGGAVRGRTPYMVEASIDLAQAAVDNAGALVATDVIQCLNIPAKTVVLQAGIETMIAPLGGTTCTADLGVTGGVVDSYADGFVVTASAAGAISAPSADANVVTTAADTLDLLLIGTTVDTSGTLRVWAIMQDVSEIGATAADEVDRDTLA